MSDNTLKPAPKRQLLEFGSNRGQVRHADDAAYSDARVPTCHAASHSANGSDPVTPESIGAACASHKHSFADLTGTAAEKHQHTLAELAGVAAQQHRHSHQDLDGVAAERHSHKHEELLGVAAEKHRHGYEDLAGVAPARHTHAAEDINTGVLDASRVLSTLTPGALLRVSENGKHIELVYLVDLLSESETVAKLRELLGLDNG